MVEDALVKDLVSVKIGCSTTYASSHDRQFQIFACYGIENGVEDLVIPYAKVRGGGTAEDDGVG